MLFRSKTLNDPAPMPTVTNIPTSWPGTRSFVVQGTNIPTCGNLTISSPDASLEISNVTSTQFTVTVAENTCTGFTFNLLYYGQRLFVSDYINPPGPFTINSVSPLSGKPGDHIIIDGANLENVRVRLSLGYFMPDQILEITGNSTQLDAIVTLPDGYNVNVVPTGDITLFIEGCNNQAIYTFHVALPNITIDDVNPKTNHGTEEIVITGTNFLSDPNLKVQLTAQFSGVLEDLIIADITDTQMTLFAPHSFYSGNVAVSIYSYGRYISSPEFLLMH